LAILPTVTSPAVVKAPPTYTSLPLIAIALASLLFPDNPDPRADQAEVVMFHLAILLAELPPAVEKLPPAYRSVPFIARART
jgi:hypothetical protein